MRNEILWGGLLAAVVFLSACDPVSTEKKSGRLCFKQKCFTVEIADTQEARVRGLMGRVGLSRGKGMFFEFPAADIYRFWMKDVSFPVDIVWLDELKQVVHVEKRVPPCRQDPCPTYSPLMSAQYVLELASGTFDIYGLKIGDQAELR